jgi:hypothetical protein
MISGIQSSSAAAASSTSTAPAGQSPASSGLVLVPDPTDTVTLSPAARAKLLDDILPTFDNIQKRAAQLTDSLNAALASAGISPSPPFYLAVDNPNSLHVTVKGSRPDAKKIEDLINGNKTLQNQIHNVDAAASQYAAFAGPAKFSRAYMAANTPAEVSAALAKYGYLFGGQQRSAAVTLGFDGASIQVDANGKPITPNIVDMPG